MKKNAKHGWQSLLAAVLSLAMLVVICVPALAALAADDVPIAPQTVTKYKIEAESGTFDPADKKQSGTNSQGDDWISGYDGMTATYTVPEGVAKGQYVISARYVSAVDQTAELQIVCGEEQKISASWARTGEWDWNQAAMLKAGVLELKAGDTFQVKAIGDSPYIQIDYFLLTLPEPKTETGDGWVRYHAEHFYEPRIKENVAADLQPGEQIIIPVNAFVDFKEGKYSLTVRSCGNRESFEILVNGQSVGNLTRKGTGFGMDQMTNDKLTQTLTLKPGDVIGLKAPSGEFWGWVDYVQLDVGVSVGHALSIGNDVVVTYDLTGKTGELGGEITSVTATIGGREIRGVTWEGNKIKVPVFAKEMRKTILVTVHTTGGDCKLTPYRVTDYLEQFQAAGGAGAAVDFLKKLYTYGDYAAAYFGGSPDQADPEGWDASRLEELKTPGREINRDHSSASYVGATLVLEDTISLRFYFKYTGTGTPTVTLDGETYQNLKQVSEGYFVEVSNIPLTRLNVAHTVTVDGETLVQNSSVLDYAYSAIKNNMKESGLCKALTVTYWSALTATGKTA